MRIKSNRKAFMAFLDNKLVNILEDVGLHLERQMKKNVSIGYPPASEPGEFPHVREGTLRRSIHHEVDRFKLLVRIGAIPLGKDEESYALYLEMGTKKMKARPFIRPTFEQEKNWIVNQFGGR